MSSKGFCHGRSPMLLLHFTRFIEGDPICFHCMLAILLFCEIWALGPHCRAYSTDIVCNAEGFLKLFEVIPLVFQINFKSTANSKQPFHPWVPEDLEPCYRVFCDDVGAGLLPVTLASPVGAEIMEQFLHPILQQPVNQCLQQGKLGNGFVDEQGVFSIEHFEWNSNLFVLYDRRPYDVTNLNLTRMP